MLEQADHNGGTRHAEGRPNRSSRGKLGHAQRPVRIGDPKDHRVFPTAQPRVRLERGGGSALEELDAVRRLAAGETVILPHPPLTLVGVSMRMEREHQQNASLANGYRRPKLVRVHELVPLWPVRGEQGRSAGRHRDGHRKIIRLRPDVQETGAGS